MLLSIVLESFQTQLLPSSNLTAQDIVHPVALGVQQGEIYQEVPINESAV